MSIFALLKNSTLLSQTPAFPPIGQSFNVLASVDSTNNYAMAQVRAGLASHGTVYMALEQTAGKGQRGRQWITQAGENIMLSAVVRLNQPLVANPFMLSASAALSCYDFFKIYAGEDFTRIKWPNDLYWQDRKAGGILIESISRAGGREANEDEKPAPLWAVIGIGININQGAFDPQLKNPVSLKQITGKNWDVFLLAKELCNRLEERYQNILSQSSSDILKEYNSVLYKRLQRVRVRKENAVFETTIAGVDEDGRLNTYDTSERSFSSGEIEWLT